MKAGNLKTENPAERDAEQVDSAAPVTTAAVSITQDGQGESRMLGQQNANYRGRGGWGGGGYPYGGGWGGSPYGGWGELSLVCLLLLCGLCKETTELLWQRCQGQSFVAGINAQPTCCVCPALLLHRWRRLQRCPGSSSGQQAVLCVTDLLAVPADACCLPKVGSG